MRSLSLKTLSVAIVLTFSLGACAAIGNPLDAGDDPCDDLQGTIQVADDATNMTELARVSEAQARDAALATLSGANVTEIDLDEEDGYLVYEVDLTVNNEEHEVYVDAGSGDVLCSERED